MELRSPLATRIIIISCKYCSPVPSRLQSSFRRAGIVTISTHLQGKKKRRRKRRDRDNVEPLLMEIIHIARCFCYPLDETLSSSSRLRLQLNSYSVLYHHIIVRGINISLKGSSHKQLKAALNPPHHHQDFALSSLSGPSWGFSVYPFLPSDCGIVSLKYHRHWHFFGTKVKSEKVLVAGH